MHPNLSIANRLGSAAQHLLFAFACCLCCHSLSLAQVPGICFSGNDPSVTNPGRDENHASLMNQDTSTLVEYLRKQGYTGRTLEQAAIQDAALHNAANNPHSSRIGPAIVPSTNHDSRIRFQASYAPHSLPSHKSPSSGTPSTGYEPFDAPKQAYRMVSAATQSIGDLDADPLSSMGPSADAERERKSRKTNSDSNGGDSQSTLDPHAEVFANTLYPSAITCAKCHQKIYDEWRVSSHAYASISPMFQRFEQLVTDLTRGTVGTFCMRCHAPVATQMNYPRQASLLEGPHIFREGITCVACHRVVERYGRVNGERRIEPGTPFDPVVGNSGGDGIPAVLADAENWKVTTDPNDKRPRQAIHRGAIQFDQLADSSFCAGCHQVVVQPGIALEIVYQQYRQGPAHKKGISCQDCHMGAVPGLPNGYAIGACAEVSGKVYRSDRKHSNHIFYGPAYPIAHPGLFPHNEKALRWKPTQWLEFDWRAGWGTEAFEKALAANTSTCSFPSSWSNAQERRDARKILDSNLELIVLKRSTALQTLENGSRIEGPSFVEHPTTGRNLKFQYRVSNLSEGHNMPSGSLGAQPQLWLNVVLIGPDGSRVWESGDLDTYGDMRDQHSLDVRARKIQPDLQLFNMQTKFLTTNLKGTEREMYLPVNLDIDPLPFFRPAVAPTTVLNHPAFIRMEAHSIAPVDNRIVTYTVPGELIRMPGVYRLSVRMRSRVEPAYFVRFVNGTPDMLRSMNEGIIDVHPHSSEFVVR